MPLIKDDHLVRCGYPTILNHATFRISRGKAEGVAAHKVMVELGAVGKVSASCPRGDGWSTWRIKLTLTEPPLDTRTSNVNLNALQHVKNS